MSFNSGVSDLAQDREWADKPLSLDGLLFEVEGELPKVPPYHQFNALTAFGRREGYKEAQQDMLDYIKRKYRPTKDLVKETE